MPLRCASAIAARIAATLFRRVGCGTWSRNDATADFLEDARRLAGPRIPDDRPLPDSSSVA